MLTQPRRRRVADVAALRTTTRASARSRRSTGQNVADLRLAWSWALPNGPNEVTPLVHDGVMFVHGYGDKVQALDAATGDLLWQYSRRLPRDRDADGEARHRALRRQALRADLRHAHRRARREDRRRRVGSGGGRPQGRLRHDRRTARRQRQGDDRHHRPRARRQLHRRARRGDRRRKRGASTPSRRPGEPGGNSWNGLPLDKRNGASVWVPASYDQTLEPGVLRTGADLRHRAAPQSRRTKAT